MKTIQELRVECQSVHIGDFSNQIVRRVSIYITWLLIPTGISANSVSVINCAIGVLGGIAFYLGNYWGVLGGAILFIANTVIDGVDGEIARYRKKSSLTGLYADRINTAFIYPFMFYGAGKGLALTTGYHWFTDIGMIGGWSMVALRLLKTSIDSTLIDAVTLSKARIEESLEGADKPADFRPMSEVLRDQRKWHVWFIDFILIRQPGMCIVWTLACSAELIMRSLAPAMPVWLSPLGLMLAGYAGLGTAAVVGGAYMIISKRKVETQFLAVFHDRMQQPHSD